jgi:hypothetical protein
MCVQWLAEYAGRVLARGHLASNSLRQTSDRTTEPSYAQTGSSTGSVCPGVLWVIDLQSRVAIQVNVQGDSMCGSDQRP